MMTHVPWKANLPVCELSAQPEFAALSVHPELRIDGDLKSTLRALGDLNQQGFPVEEIQALRRDILYYFKRPGQARLAAQDVIEIVRRVLPPDGILFSETGVFVCMLEHLWPVGRPGIYYGTSGGRTMGLTLPAILGARLAEQKRPMVGIGADGSLLMRLGELETFKRAGVAVPLVIINDQALGTMKSRQKSRGMPDYALDFSPVDFTAIARACGLHGVHVDDPDTLEKELQQAMVSSSTTLIDARVDSQIYQDSFGPAIGILSPK
jgi:thiamine pyrophosphate-dependent acetolactate synthase large subunit-like protein